MHAWARLSAAWLQSIAVTGCWGSSSILVASILVEAGWFELSGCVGEGVEMDDRLERLELPVFEVRPEVIDSVEIDFESVTPDDAPAIWTEFQ